MKKARNKKRLSNVDNRDLAELSIYNLLALYFHDYQVFVKLIRRYKYLERAFEDEMKKVLMYTKGFKPEQRTKLADVTAVFLAQVGFAMVLPPFLAPPCHSKRAFFLFTCSLACLLARLESYHVSSLSPASFLRPPLYCAILTPAFLRSNRVLWPLEF